MIKRTLFFGNKCSLTTKYEQLNIKTTDRETSIPIEDIGFIYSRLIEEDIANVSVMFIDVEGNKKNKNVAALKPNIEKTISPGTGNELVKIDGNMVSLDYEFIAIKDSNNRKYYKKNMSNSGVEISINGRVIAYNLFQEIWNIEKHNSYNYLLVRLNIKSDDPKTLPTTRTSKNGIRKGDKKIEDLYLWIRNHISNPSKKIEDATHEIELFKELSEIKEKQLGV